MSLEKKWHPSHQSENWHKAMLELYTPAKPLKCHLCGWPGSIGAVCTVCTGMVNALAHRPNRYWIDTADATPSYWRKPEAGV